MEFLGDKPMNVVVPAVLFTLLAPGNFVMTDLSGIKLGGMHSWTSIALHTGLFVVLYVLLRRQFAEYY